MVVIINKDADQEEIKSALKKSNQILKNQS
jgi:hypothetical protein